jgi:hypothetical protein
LGIDTDIAVFYLPLCSNRISAAFPKTEPWQWDATSSVCSRRDISTGEKGVGSRCTSTDATGPYVEQRLAITSSTSVSAFFRSSSITLSLLMTWLRFLTGLTLQKMGHDEGVTGLRNIAASSEESWILDGGTVNREVKIC